MAELVTPIVDDLKDLQIAAIDAQNGYEEALRDADGKGATLLFQQMIDIHGKNSADLASELVSRHELADKHGSLMSNVHRAIMDVRSMFGGLDDSVLPGLIDGEKRNVKGYEAILRRGDLTEADRSLLSTNMSRLQFALQNMEQGQARSLARKAGREPT